MAVKEYVSNKVSKLTRYGKNITSYDFVKDQNIEIKNLALKVFGTKELLKNAKNETFNDAKKRYGLKEVDIIELYKGLSTNFYTYLALSIILFFSSFYVMFVVKNIVTILVVLVLMCVCLANCFKYSFRSYQVKNRNLCSVRYWYESGEYLPEIIGNKVFSTLEDSEQEDKIDKDLEEQDEIEYYKKLSQEEEKIALEKSLEFTKKMKKMEDDFNNKLNKDKQEAIELLRVLNENNNKEESKGDKL